MGTIKKTWYDETGWSSKIENLNFPGDRKWNSCNIKVIGTKYEQKFIIIISENGNEVKKENFTLSKDETREIDIPINKECSVSVTGELIRPALSVEGAGGKVEVECSFTKGKSLNLESVSWKDETGGESCIENLFLRNNHYWEKCEIKIEGKQGKETGCMTTLIANGELAYPLPSWVELNGTETKLFAFDIKQQVPLLVAGYITNHEAITGGGAKVTLTGYYS